MNKPTEYIVVFSQTINDKESDENLSKTTGLVTLINKKIKEGWVPIGGISSHHPVNRRNGIDPRVTHTQSMVKY